VIQRICHRCHNVLTLQDDGTLSYCPNCGAPQVTLSEELREQAELQRQEFEAGTDAHGQPVVKASSLDLLMRWRPAIGIAAIVAAGLSVLAAAMPAMELLAWIAPALVLSIYSIRHRETLITASVGARVGVVCGIFSAFGMTLAMSARMLVQRLAFHHPSDVEANMSMLLAQSKAQAIAQGGAAGAATFDHILSTPELFAGFFLTAVITGAVFLLVLSTAGGAFAGFVRSKTRVR
jgi:predicted RNA-binding Zn-ribbon protein involved in translation (DUF1610 family)